MAWQTDALEWVSGHDQIDAGCHLGLYGDQLPPASLVPKGDDQNLHDISLDMHRGCTRREVPGSLEEGTTPLHLGGLGIMDFNLLGRTLCLRWLWLSQTNHERPLALHPVADDASIEAFFQASIRCVVGDGESTFYWTNPWLNGRCIDALMLELLEAVPLRARRWRTVAVALVGHAWIRDIDKALTILVLMQYLHLHQ
jgi:hypothetical protein